MVQLAGPGPLTRVPYNCEGNGWAFQRQKHSRDVFRLQAGDGRPIYQQQSVAWEKLSTGAAQSMRTDGCGHVCVNEYTSHKRSIPHASRPMPLMWQHASCLQGTRQGTHPENKEHIRNTLTHPGNKERATCTPLLSLSNDTPILFTCHASPLPSIFYQSNFTISSRFTRSSNICGVANIHQTQTHRIPIYPEERQECPAHRTPSCPFSPYIHIRGFHAEIVRSGCVDRCVAAGGMDAVTNIHACDE